MLDQTFDITIQTEFCFREKENSEQERPNSIKSNRVSPTISSEEAPVTETPTTSSTLRLRSPTKSNVEETLDTAVEAESPTEARA